MKKLFQNKCLALLLVFVMIWGMLPFNVMAAGQTVKVAGIELADGQCLTNNSATSATTWTEGDPYVAYYKDGVLYLNNLETEQVNSCIYFRGNSDLIIDVTGNNTLVRTAGTCINVESYTYGLVVQGTGTLTATGSSFGFWVRENVTFQGNVTVVAEGTSDVGIASNRGNTGLSDTKITIKDNARVTATGGKYGIGGDHDRTPKVVVEDNALLRHHLKVQIQDAGHQVDDAEDAKEADYYLNEHLPDIAIVDLGLPDEDGLSLIRRWRSNDVSLPILVLTARESWQDKVEVLSAGADDYVTKPFHIEEVMARMQALMRRNSGLASQVISLPPFQVDLSRRELSINDEVIKLTAFEYTIMETLIRNNGKVVSKDSLMLQLYPDAELRESHTIDVLMGRLRKKIQAQYPQEVITTVRGQGYLFELR